MIAPNLLTLFNPIDQCTRSTRLSNKRGRVEKKGANERPLAHYSKIYWIAFAGFIRLQYIFWIFEYAEMFFLQNGFVSRSIWANFQFWTNLRQFSKGVKSICQIGLTSFFDYFPVFLAHLGLLWPILRLFSGFFVVFRLILNIRKCSKGNFSQQQGEFCRISCCQILSNKRHHSFWYLTVSFLIVE